MNWENKFSYYGIGIFFLLFFLFFILINVNAFSNIQSTITDKLHGNGNNLENIVLIEIDDESINKIGRWPWDRDVFAHILLKLKGAKVIGVDLSFFEESKNDSLLNKTLQEMDNVILAAEISSNDEKIYKPIFDTDFGYVNLVSDGDGVIRSLRKKATKEVLPFSYKIYKKAWNLNNDKKFPDSLYRINFASKPGGFQSINALEILNNNSFDFSNKFVLVGVTAPDLHDVYMVPTSEGIAMSGVEIQAQILQNFILNDFIK